MKSIKPGRGPSAMGAIGSAFAVVFGIFWTVMVSSMGGPGFFSLFGVIFIIIGIIQFIYNIKNATSKNRMSVYDITDETEEYDPISKFVSKSENKELDKNKTNFKEGKFNYCPFCGAKMNEEYKFCPSCGKGLNREM